MGSRSMSGWRPGVSDEPTFVSDGDAFTEQFVLLRIGFTSDCRGWDWPEVIDEPLVDLIGWYGRN